MNDLQLKSVANGADLTIIPTGRIDTQNAGQFKAFYSAEAEKQAHAHLFLDLSALTYISSAGLRVLLFIVKAEPNRVQAIDVAPSVYEVFETSGFTDLLQARRALRQVSIEGCERIGQGMNGQVYRLDGETILKLYSDKTPIEDIERERKYARQAFLKGIPTAISYDIVKCEDRLGIVFELIQSQTVSKTIYTQPEKLPELAVQYSNMVKDIHAIDAEDIGLLNVKTIWKAWVDCMRQWLTEEEADVCVRLIDSIPDRSSFLHGDLHPNNIMLQNGDMLLIDMADLCHGHPIFDLAGMAISMVFAGEQDANMTYQIIGITKDQALAMWNAFLPIYFGTTDANFLAARMQQISGLVLLKTVLAPGMTKSLPEELRNLVLALGREQFFPIAEQLIGALAQDW